MENLKKEKVEEYDFFMESACMYNYRVTCTIGKNSYKAICEFAPAKANTLLIWMDDFQFPLDEIEDIKTSFEIWLSKQNIKPIFYDGKRI